VLEQTVMPAPSNSCLPCPNTSTFVHAIFCMEKVLLVLHISH